MGIWKASRGGRASDAGDERGSRARGPRRGSASRYRLDAADRVKWVSDGWVDYARANAADSLRTDDVLGRSVWEFIDGAEVTGLYHALFQKVRSTGEAVTLLCHCDSPRVKREMEIRIVPHAEGGIEVVATIVSEQSRPAVPLLDHALPRSDDVLSMCSWCRRVLTHPDRWLPIEHAIEELELFSGRVLPKLSHGACPDCYSRVMAAEGLA